MREPIGTPAMPVLRKRREIMQGLAALAAAGWMPASLAQAAPASMAAARFTTLSTAMTGFAFGDPDVAKAMLRALNATVGPTALARIATLAAVIAPDQLGDELKIAGLEKAAASVVTALYSGVVVTLKGPVVITYDQALAWQAVPWTKPNAECGGMTDYWASAPART